MFYEISYHLYNCVLSSVYPHFVKTVTIVLYNKNTSKLFELYCQELFKLENSKVHLDAADRQTRQIRQKNLPERVTLQ